jgi:apolipoprotein N-acyltransferase
VQGGTGPLLVDAGACRVGTLVCSDAQLPALARELALAGADAIVVATNDAPLPRRAVASEVAQARLRAVETGVPVLRAANAGESLAIDRYGRTLERRRGVVALTAAAPGHLAPATRWGAPFVALCAAATVLSVAAGLVAPRRR